MTDRPRLVIRWRLDPDVPADGVAGIDSERVEVDNLVRWAKRRRRELRRAMRAANGSADG